MNTIILIEYDIRIYIVVIFNIYIILFLINLLNLIINID